MRQAAHILSKKYNDLYENDDDRNKILDELVPNRGTNVYLQGPIQFDYGCFTEIGDNSYANFNLTCLDCAPVKIGKNVFMGPNVSLLTPVHPLMYQDRNVYTREDGTITDKEYARPIVIGVTVGLREMITVCGGVTNRRRYCNRGRSVVTHDIPQGVIAAGVPCRVIRKLTEADRLENHPELL